MKTFLFAVLSASLLALGAMWMWGDKLGIPLNQIILDLHKARIESVSAARRANDEIIRTMETKAEAEDATAAAVQTTKELEKQRLELERSAAKLRNEANRLRNTTPAPATPAPSNTSAGISEEHRGRILPAGGGGVTPPALANQVVQVADRKSVAGEKIEIPAGTYFFRLPNGATVSPAYRRIVLEEGDTRDGAIREWLQKFANDRNATFVSGPHNPPQRVQRVGIDSYMAKHMQANR